MRSLVQLDTAGGSLSMWEVKLTWRWPDGTEAKEVRRYYDGRLAHRELERLIALFQSGEMVEAA